MLKMFNLESPRTTQKGDGGEDNYETSCKNRELMTTPAAGSQAE